MRGLLYIYVAARKLSATSVSEIKIFKKILSGTFVLVRPTEYDDTYLIEFFRLWLQRINGHC